MTERSSSETSGPSGGEFTPALNAAELLAAQGREAEARMPEAGAETGEPGSDTRAASGTSETDGPAPERSEPTSTRHLEQVLNFVQQRRAAADVLDGDGKLSVERKFEASAYDVLTLDYYRRVIKEQQGIPMPPYESDEELREALVMHTQSLIEDIEQADPRPDMLFFLDKSARPVSWMLRDLWPLFAEQPDKPLPAIKFINIDVNRVFNQNDDSPRPTPDTITEWQPTQEQVADLRQIYDRDGRPVPEHPDDAHKAWIIDEVSISGGSTEVSRKMLKAAFPDLDLVRKTWMPAGKHQVGRRGHEVVLPNQLAPWYSKDFKEGRGVGEATTQPFLSSRTAPDILTEALRTDIQLLARDIVEGRQSVRPMGNCYETDPVTGQEDLNRPKYKLARFVDGQRTIIPANRPATDREPEAA